MRPGFEKTDLRRYQQLEFRESCFTYYTFQVALLAAWQANYGHPHSGNVEIALLAFVPPCGKRLRILRRQQGQSIESVSAITGIATVDIRSIEDGLPATAINLIALARYYDVPVGTITGAFDRKIAV
ncbi:MAG: helix-turn-helix transcriptional regulator [Okeania sp. SIO1H6]|nr:helix-turn-helix transcriptional regulator [Okeania sp. SIO1H6]